MASKFAGVKARIKAHLPWRKKPARSFNIVPRATLPELPANDIPLCLFGPIFEHEKLEEAKKIVYQQGPALLFEEAFLSCIHIKLTRDPWILRCCQYIEALTRLPLSDYKHYEQVWFAAVSLHCFLNNIERFNNMNKAGTVNAENLHQYNQLRDLKIRAKELEIHLRKYDDAHSFPALKWEEAEDIFRRHSSSLHKETEKLVSRALHDNLEIVEYVELICKHDNLLTYGQLMQDLFRCATDRRRSAAPGNVIREKEVLIERLLDVEVAKSRLERNPAVANERQPLRPLFGMTWHSETSWGEMENFLRSRITRACAGDFSYGDKLHILIVSACFFRANQRRHTIDDIEIHLQKLEATVQRMDHGDMLSTFKSHLVERIVFCEDLDDCFEELVDKPLQNGAGAELCGLMHTMLKTIEVTETILSNLMKAFTGHSSPENLAPDFLPSGGPHRHLHHAKIDFVADVKAKHQHMMRVAYKLRYFLSENSKEKTHTEIVEIPTKTAKPSGNNSYPRRLPRFNMKPKLQSGTGRTSLLAPQADEIIIRGQKQAATPPIEWIPTNESLLQEIPESDEVETPKPRLRRAKPSVLRLTGST